MLLHISSYLRITQLSLQKQITKTLHDFQSKFIILCWAMFRWTHLIEGKCLVITQFHPGIPVGLYIWLFVS